MTSRPAAFCCALALIPAALSCNRRTDEDVVRAFVRAWPAGGSTLAGTITGARTDELVDALQRISRGPVERAELVRRGVVLLLLDDGASLRLEIRASVEDGKVIATPSAISTRLRRFSRLRIDDYGAPKRGAILSRKRVRLAHGPRRDRILRRNKLARAIELIDEALDGELAGRKGHRLVAGANGDVLASSRPSDGHEVQTSFDEGLQKAAESALGTASGALIAVDPRTGGIRAFISEPTDDAPRRSPATSAYSPGSTFKIVTAAAALEHNVLERSDRVPCPARITQGERQISNFGGIAYGRITFERAFAVSCNTAFAQIGVAVGTSRLLETAKRFGFEVGELDGPGKISTPSSRAELAVWSFGADGSRVSPMEMAGIGTTIARGGKSVPIGWTDEPRTSRRVLSRDSAEGLLKMMEEVVASGTGRNAAVRGVKIAGKTGTADPEGRRGLSDAWFVGLAPSRDTELVAVALVPVSGLGSRIPATIVGSFFATAEVG